MAGPTPIPVSEVAAYCDLAGILEPVARLHMLRVIQRIDADYLTALRDMSRKA